MKNILLLLGCMFLASSAYAQDDWSSVITTSSAIVSGSGTGDATATCVADPINGTSTLTVTETQTSTITGFLYNTTIETDQIVTITQNGAAVAGSYIVLDCRHIGGPNDGCNSVATGVPVTLDNVSTNNAVLCDATGLTTQTIVPVPIFGNITTTAAYTKD